MDVPEEPGAGDTEARHGLCIGFGFFPQGSVVTEVV
jgi:hypothetical protein